MIELVLQLVGVAGTPLKVTTLVATVAPKFDPEIVIGVPIAAAGGERPVITGTGPLTVNRTPLLAFPPTTTRMFPVVAPVGTLAVMEEALQLVAVTTIP